MGGIWGKKNLLIGAADPSTWNKKSPFQTTLIISEWSRCESVAFPCDSSHSEMNRKKREISWKSPKFFLRKVNSEMYGFFILQLNNRKLRFKECLFWWKNLKIFPVKSPSANPTRIAIIGVSLVFPCFSSLSDASFAWRATRGVARVVCSIPPRGATKTEVKETATAHRTTRRNMGRYVKAVKGLDGRRGFHHSSEQRNGCFNRERIWFDLHLRITFMSSLV